MLIAARIDGLVARFRGAIWSFIARPRTLLSQLLTLAAVGMLPLTLFSGVLLWQLAAREHSQYEVRLQQTALNLAADIDRQLVGMIAMLKTLATSQMLEREQFADFHAQALEAIAGQSVAIILARPDGRQVLNTRVAYGSPLPSIADLETLQRVVATRTHAVSNLFVGNIAKAPQINIHVPVVRNGTLMYDLLMAFSPSLIRDILNQQFLPAEWVTGVTDIHSRVIARSRDHEEYVNTVVPANLPLDMADGKPFASRRADGTPVIRTAARLQHATWLVSATLERTSATEALRSAVAALMLAGVLLIGGVTLIAGGLAWMLSRDLRDVGEAADRLDAGKPFVPVDGVVQELNEVKANIAKAVQRRLDHEQERNLLLRELNHRVKNSFAVLQSILNATLRSTSDPAEFAQSFKGRLHSMAAAQDILTSSEWTAADLQMLARGQLAAYVGGEPPRLLIDGPSVELPTDLAVPVGLILHELGTNAAKYGALSRPGGEVSLTWTLVGPAADRVVAMEWRERGGPAVTEPRRRGFGSTLIERGLPSGTVERTFTAEGVRCRITVPLERPNSLD